MRILLDTNILVRAHEKATGSARSLLRGLLGQKHTLLISPEMIVEVARVLRYPRLHALYGLTEEQVYQYTVSARRMHDCAC